MYIRAEEFKFLQRLYKRLDEEGRRRFLKTLLEAGGKGPGEGNTLKLQLILGERLWEEEKIDPNEVITRTMIRQAYREARGK